MTQRNVLKLIVAAVGLSIAFGTGAMWAGGTTEVSAASTKVTGPIDQAAAIKGAAATDALIDGAEGAVDLAQIEYDEALADLNSPTPSRTYAPDPEIQMGMRHSIELNEQICRETGQNCEFAKMARRQYQETYGSK